MQLGSPTLSLGAAETAWPQLNDDQQRLAFTRAEHFLKKGAQKQYRQLAQQLKDYPLYPYLHYKRLIRRFSQKKTQEVSRFLKDYHDSPLATKLRNRWLSWLSKKKLWSLYIEFHLPTENVTQRCLYLRALYNTGQKSQALDQVAKIWLFGKSQPKACDPIFHVWRQDKRQTVDLTWQRILLALKKGQTSLARFLARGIPTQDKQQFKLLIKVNRYPHRVGHAEFVSNKHSRANMILHYGLLKLIKRRPEQAQKVWSKLAVRVSFDPAQINAIESALALRLALNYSSEAKYWLDRLDKDHQSEALQRWHIRYALKQNDWPHVLSLIENLPAQEIEREQWCYWRARALEKTGQNGQALVIYQYLAKIRHYYGFLASFRLGLQPSLHQAKYQYDEQTFNQLQHKPGIQRARELYLLDRIGAARLEWEMATDALADTELAVAAKIAQHWGWVDRSIMTASKMANKNDLDLRFPRVNQRRFLLEAERRSINPAWAFAVARQESAYMSDARSNAGALGFMQLLPATAKQVGKKIGVRFKRNKELLNPVLNIKLGTAYLSELLTRFKGDQVAATAAYNAGPHRVKKWDPGGLSYDQWVETIPWKETRNYVKNILAYTVVYDSHLDRPLSLSKLHLAP